MFQSDYTAMAPLHNHHHHQNNYLDTHRHLSNLNPNYNHPLHQPNHRYLPANQYNHSQDTDFSAHSMAGTRRMLDMPLGHHSIGGSAAATHHLSASSTSSINGVYNGMGGSGGTNLIINYLPQDMTDRELYSLFRTMGPIESCRIMRDFKVDML